MQILITIITCILLITAPLKVRKKVDTNTADKEHSYNSMEEVTDQFGKEFIDYIVSDVVVTTTNQPIIYNHTDGDITLRLYHNGVKYVLEQIILTIRQDAMKHRPYTMRTSYNGMDINLDSMRIVDVLPPEFDVEHLNVSRFRFHTHGGGMRYLGSYSTIYKTTREGQFEALLDDVRIHIDVEFLYEENQIKVIENTCDSKISEILLQLIPSMPLQILGLLKDRIQQSFRENVCPALLHFARKLAHIMTSLAAVEDFTSPQREPYHKCALPYERITSQFNSHGAIFSFKRCILRKTSDQHTSDSLVDAEISMESEMASISITERYINDMLNDLTENGNIIFHLHRVPEIQKILRIECDDQNCLGHYVNLNQFSNETGQLDSRVIATPRIKLNHEHAILHLILSTALSFENLADQYRIPYLHFKTKVSLRMTQLNATFSDNSGYYRWCARYEINHIKTYDVHSNFEELVDISNNIEQQIKKHRSYLEDLMATYLNGELPLRLNPRIRLLPHPAIFRDRRIIFPINFKFDKKFLPVFQLFHASSFW